MLNDYPASENWRFFIDGYRQHEGKWAFDSGAGAEQGYYAAMQGSWDRMLTTLTAPLSVAELKNIHDYCVGKGKGQQAVAGVVDETEYRTTQGDFGLVSQESDALLGNVSVEGAAELFQKVLDNDPNLPPLILVSIDDKGFTQDFVVDRTLSAQQNAQIYCNLINEKGGKLLVKGNAEEFVETYITEFNQNIKKAKTDDEKLLAIASCISQIERLHPFYDGNCRTMLILTNKLLMQNGLPPCIYENPNRIDMFSNAEIVNEIKKGQALFKEYKTTAATDKIQSLTSTQLQDPVAIEKAIITGISSQPLQSLEQLNQLFQKVISGEIHLQSNAPVHRPSRMSFLTSKSSKVNNIDVVINQNAVLSVIQKLYGDRLNAIKDNIKTLQQEVDTLKNDKATMENQLTALRDQSNQPQADKTTLRRQIEEVQEQLSGVSQKLDRASKAERWFVDRFNEIKQDHKKLLTGHTSFAKDSLKSTFKELHKVAKREAESLVVGANI